MHTSSYKNILYKDLYACVYGCVQKNKQLTWYSTASVHNSNDNKNGNGYNF